MLTYYEVLRADPGATHEELRLAYLTRAHELHPDLHHAAPASVIDRLNMEMSEVNEAWRVLGDHDTRRHYDALLFGFGVRRDPPPPFQPPYGAVVDARRSAAWKTAPWHPGSSGQSDPHDFGTAERYRTAAAPKMPRPRFNRGAPPGDGPLPTFDIDSPTAVAGGGIVESFVPEALPWRDPATDPAGIWAVSTTVASRPPVARRKRVLHCMYCGWSPAAKVTLKGVRPALVNLFYSPTRSVQGPLCRSCGLSLFRDLTDFVLVGGGAGAGFMGFGLPLQWLTAIGNVTFWPRIRFLKAPSREGAVRAPLSSPLEPGRSLLLRGGMFFVYLACAVVALVAVATSFGIL